MVVLVGGGEDVGYLASSSTHSGTNSSVDRDHGAHDSVAEYKSTDRQSPIEATGNHGGRWVPGQ